MSNDQMEEEDDHIEYSWFDSLRAELVTIHNYQPSIDFTNDFEENELLLSKQEKKTIEKHKQERRNWIIKETSGTGQYFLVKQDKNATRALNEYNICKVLHAKEVPHVIAPLAFFLAKYEESDETEFGWIVSPWMKSKTLSSLLQQPSLLSTRDWCNGLLSMLELLAFTDPHRIDSAIKLFHKDLHAEQIVFVLETRKWFLVDFGMSEIHWTDKPDFVKLTSAVTHKLKSSSSVPSSYDEYQATFRCFLSDGIVQALGETGKAIKKLKNRQRSVAVTQLKNIISQMDEEVLESPLNALC